MPRVNLNSLTSDDLDTVDLSHLGPEDQAVLLARILKERLETTGLIEVVETQVAVNQIHFLCRVKEEHEADLVNLCWYPMLEQVYRYGVFDFGTRYFLKEIGGRLQRKYAWQLSVGSENLQEAVLVMCRTLDVRGAGTRKKLDLSEIPMIGDPEPMGSLASGKKGVSLTK